MTNTSQGFPLIRKHLPPTVTFTNEGGMDGNFSISGKFEDIVEFVEKVYEEGFKGGCEQTEFYERLGPGIQ